MRKRKKTGRLWMYSGAVALTAMLSMAGIAVVKQAQVQQKEEKQQEQEQTAKAEREEKKEKKTEEQDDEIQEQDQGAEQTAQIESEAQESQEEETQNVAAMIEANKAQSDAPSEEEAQAEPVAETAVEPEAQQHFSESATLQWPVEGSVLMNYSMDSTVYFSTLQQYKYNPAMIIAGNVNEKVAAAAAGTVTDISSNEETGCTVTMDLGDGYTAIYGQLKELSCSVGDYLEAGSVLGHISEPTKYYSSEGCNLFFELQKDGTPIDPLSFLE